MANGRTRKGSSVARLSLLLTVALAAPAWSQVQTGRIVGNVRDAQQAMVPRANVTVTSSATGQAVNVTTNDRGDYVVTPVNPGFYRVTVAMTGFQTAVVNAVEVPVGQSVRVDVELKVGALAETTEVTAASPLLDTESGSLGHHVTNTTARRPAAQRPQLLRARPPDPGSGGPPRRSERRADPRELHQRHRDQRRARQPAHVPDRRRRRDRPPPGRLLHPDLRRRPPGDQGPAERLLRRVQPGGRDAERGHQVGRQRVPRRGLRVPAQRRLRRRRLLREAEAGAQPAPVRGDARRAARHGQDVLLRELRRDPREPGAARQPDRGLGRDEAGRLQRHPEHDLRPAHRAAVPGEHHPHEPAVAAGAVLQRVHPGSEHELRHLRLVRGPQAERRPVHDPGRPQPQREAPDIRPLQLPRQPHGRSRAPTWARPTSPIPRSAAPTFTPAARTSSRR